MIATIEIVKMFTEILRIWHRWDRKISYRHARIRFHRFLKTVLFCPIKIKLWLWFIIPMIIVPRDIVLITGKYSSNNIFSRTYYSSDLSGCNVFIR